MRVGARLRTARFAARRERGATLVEFALVIPLFLLLIVALAELAFAVSAITSTSFASRDAVLLASESGNASWADGVILRQVMRDVGAPADPKKITQVVIFKSDPGGTPSAQNLWVAGGETKFTDASGETFTVPFTLSSEAYPPSSRCSAIAGIGCTAGATGPDIIGVEVVYEHKWVTPLAGLLDWSGSGWEFSQTNTMFIEPTI